MSIFDSAAAFERKCKELRGGEELITGLSTLGVTDFSTLAFTLGTSQRAPTNEQSEDLEVRFSNLLHWANMHCSGSYEQSGTLMVT